jgi:hypothetical protein
MGTGIQLVSRIEEQTKTTTGKNPAEGCGWWLVLI